MKTHLFKDYDVSIMEGGRWMQFIASGHSKDFNAGFPTFKQGVVQCMGQKLLVLLVLDAHKVRSRRNVAFLETCLIHYSLYRLSSRRKFLEHVCCEN